MSHTQYVKVAGHSVGLTANDDYVLATTPMHNLGWFKIERFGPEPFTPSGRLTAKAIRTGVANIWGDDAVHKS